MMMKRGGGQVGKGYGVCKFVAVVSMRFACNTKFNVTVVVVVCFGSCLAAGNERNEHILLYSDTTTCTVTAATIRPTTIRQQERAEA